MNRDEEIVHLWKNELMTLSAIGKRFGLTRERVRQIVSKKRTQNVPNIRTTGNGEDNDAA